MIIIVLCFSRIFVITYPNWFLIQTNLKIYASLNVKGNFFIEKLQRKTYSRSISRPKTKQLNFSKTVKIFVAV